DAEDAQPVERDAERDRGPADAGPERRQAGEMHQHERDGRRIHDVVVLVLASRIARSGRINVAIARREEVRLWRAQGCGRSGARVDDAGSCGVLRSTMRRGAWVAREPPA